MTRMDLAAVWTLTCASTLAMASEPLLEKQTLFSAEAGGYAAYRIPALLATPRGSLLAVCEARKSRGDWAAIDILLRRSTDGGHTWSDVVLMSHTPGPHRKNPAALKQKLADPNVVTNNNPLLIADHQTGEVHLLFCQEYLRCFYCSSDDDGVTFSRPVEITAAFEPFHKWYDWNVLATGPGHGIQLKNGRLLVPVWLSTGKGGHAHRPSVVTTLYSDNHGASWLCGERVANEVDPLVNPSESVAVQLADGRVLINLRSEALAHRRGVSLSADGATGWTKPSFDEQLLEPICMASLCRVSEATSGGRNRIVFSNPHNLDKAKGQAEPGKSRDRKNLSVKLSYDEANTWPISQTLEAGASGYSDLAVARDGMIYCLYERPGVSPEPIGPSLVLAKFNLEWLTGGKDSFPKATVPAAASN
jgi:sialidase-1